MKAKCAETIEHAEAIGLAPVLPCGCKPPFKLCPVADDLLNAEWDAGDAMLRLAACEPVDEAAYAAAKAKWQAAVRAYDSHIGKLPAAEHPGKRK